MVTKKTLEELGCANVCDYCDKLLEWMLGGMDIRRNIKKLSPEQRVDALLYLNGSQAEEHIVLFKMIKNGN